MILSRLISRSLRPSLLTHYSLRPFFGSSLASQNFQINNGKSVRSISHNVDSTLTQNNLSIETIFEQQTKNLSYSSLNHEHISNFTGKDLLTLYNEELKHQTECDFYNPTPEHLELRKLIRNIVTEKVESQALQFNRDEQFNLNLFRELGDLKLLGVTADKKYGGLGMDATAAVIIHEELSFSDPAFCLSYLAHSMLFVNNLNQNGSEEQKTKYLPAVCSGRKIGGMGMSEPGAGTDVLGMRTNAQKSADGSYYTLNGNKMWITNGTIDGKTTGDVFLVYAKTGQTDRDVSMFIVEKDMPGFTLGQKIENKLGMRASMTAELVFDNVRIPKENLVGVENKAVLCMMRNLEIERVTLAGMSLGIASRCIKAMSDAYVKEMATRRHDQHFERKFISENYGDFLAGRAYTYNVARHLNLSTYGNGLDADGVKLFCAAMGKRVAANAMQLSPLSVLGENVIERLWRDAKLLEIGGGTNEAHQKNMVRDLKKRDHL